MNSAEMRAFASGIELEKAYDFVEVFMTRIIEEETARGNMMKIVMCMTETQFCQLICNHPAVANAVHVGMMRRVYRAINASYNNALAHIVRTAPARVIDRRGNGEGSQLN